MRQIKLHPRPSVPKAVLEDRGRVMTAAEVAHDVCQGLFVTKWVIRKMAPAIGTKPGREWLFFEHEARAWWIAHLDKARTREGRGS